MIRFSRSSAQLFPAFLAATCALLARPAAADDDPRSWVDRMGHALEYLNYEGTLVHLHGAEAAVMRVVHRVENGVPTERITAMDEVGREIIRRGDDVTCILPDQKEVLIEEGAAGKQGSSPLRQQFAGDVEFDDRFYRLVIATGGRLLGRETRVVTVRPTDNLRYGYRLWLDNATAIPLKVQVAGDDGVVVEQLLFSDISLPVRIPASAVQPSMTIDGFVRQPSPRSAPPEPPVSGSSAWEVGSLPPGFRLRAVRSQHSGTAALEHLVYTDGVASVSVFIEAGVTPTEQGEGPSVVGSANAWTTVHSGYLVTAVGEVPVRTVETIARSVRPLVAETRDGESRQ